LDIQETWVRIHLARKHALEFELLDVLLDGRDVALHFARSGLVVLLDGKRQQFTGILEPVRDAIERCDDLIEARALAAELLGAIGRVPDRRIFQLAIYFREALALVVVLKGTSSAPRCAR
jgi:hypothetical protein